MRGSDRLRFEVAALCLGGIGSAAIAAAAIQAFGQPGQAVGAVAAAVVAGGGAIYLHLRRRAEEEDRARWEREEARLSLAVVLLAEITANRRAFIVNGETRPSAARARFLAAMARNPAYVPFLVADEAPARVFNAVLDRLTALPARVVEPVVEYYSADDAATTAIKALRAPDFLALDAGATPEGGSSRRAAFVAQVYDALIRIYETGEHVESLADRAIAALEAYIAEQQAAGHAAPPTPPGR